MHTEDELSHLHLLLLQSIISRGFAPDTNELADTLGVSREETLERLRALADYHGVVLHPHNSAVWVVHPFALAPTLFRVRSARGEWWGNCAWCSLGIAALLGEDVTIRTTLGADGEQADIHIVDGIIAEKTYWIHFPVPMANAWDNVIYTCSTMLVFDDPARIPVWCARHRIPQGDIQPIANIWDFARVWYGNHLNPDWRKWTAAEAAQIFARFGLTGPTWNLPSAETRF